MVFMSLVLVLIGQFCRDVIDRQNVKVAVIGRCCSDCVTMLILKSDRVRFASRNTLIWFAAEYAKGLFILYSQSRRASA